MKRYIATFIACFTLVEMQAQLITGGQITTTTTLRVLPDTTEVRILSNVPVCLTLNDSNMGELRATPYVLRYGKYKIKLSATDYYTKKKTINVQRNRQNVFQYHMYKNPLTEQQKAKSQKNKLAFKQYVDSLPWTNTILLNYIYDGGHSLGITFARCKFAGFYVNTMIGLDWSKPVGTCHIVNSNYWNYRNYYKGDYYLTNQRKDQRLFSITAGGVIRMGCPLYFYTGIGYGYNRVLYKSIDNHWVAVESEYDYSVSTFSAFNYQCGLMGTYKGVTISVGYSLLASPHSYVHSEIQVGIGYTFNR